MTAQLIFTQVINIMNSMIHSFEYKCDARQQPEFFSRKGKLGFVNTIALSLNFLTKSIKAEINGFFDYVLVSESEVTKQAYLEARTKLKVEAFSMLFEETARLTADRNPELKEWHGFRIDAVDGSTLQLQDTPSLRGYYGVCGGEKGIATARISALVDVLNNGIILDAHIAKFETGERELAYAHHQRLLELGVADKHLILYDRGYISEGMLIDLQNKGISYVFRVRRNLYNQIDKITKPDSVIYLKIRNNKYRVRVIKLLLDTGEIETLVTNLPMNEFPHEWMKELYGLRWGIETGYDVIKNYLQIESFTGSSQLLIEQDFYATMFLRNMAALAKLGSDNIIEQNAKPENKYIYQTNVNILISILKDRLIMAMLEPDPEIRDIRIMKIIKKASRVKVPIRYGRKFPHEAKHVSYFADSKKRAL